MADAEPSAVPLVVPDEHTVKPVSSPWDMIASMDFMAIEIQMILSAILIIWVGAHASLRRPPSAAPPAKKRNKNGKDGTDEKDNEDNFVGGFEAMDAIKFPIIAATMLIGLYYLIKWLQDPAMLNMILRLYMAVTGFASTGVFFGDLVRLSLDFIFPDYWEDGRGCLYKVDQRSRSQKRLITGSEQDTVETQVDPEKRTPLPGFLSHLPIPPRINNFLYSLRHLAREEWTLELSMAGLGKEIMPFRATSPIGIFIGTTVQCLYLFTSSNMLANIIGLAVCYVAFQYVSVTSFAIGSSVLTGLFVYDIVMVFYTPFMVAVATQLDAPIKLTYETANRSSILGLGDIVVPGIFICLALRFDLWKHYQQKITREKTELKTVIKDGAQDASLDGTSSGEITAVATAYRDVKAPFIDPRGTWGDRFWTSSLIGIVLGNSSLASLNDSSFSKPYFWATIFGYFLGMLATLAVLIVTRQGQPALLYLVPGVVGSAYLTGWWRGELGDMWKYTEDGSLDVEDVVVDVDGEGNVIKAPKEKSDEKDASALALENKKDADGKNEEEEGDDSYKLFSLLIKVPKEDSLKED